MDAQEAGRLIEKKVLERLSANPEGARSFGKSIAIEISGEVSGRWIIDCSKDPVEVRADESAVADATISMDSSAFSDLLNGATSPQKAFLSGKAKVDGDLGAAIRFGMLLA